MKLHNVLVQSEHHVGLFADAQIFVAVDCWEHAYFMDYGTKKPDYLNTVVQSLNWTTIEQRIKMSPLGHDAPK